MPKKRTGIPPRWFRLPRKPRNYRPPAKAKSPESSQIVASGSGGPLPASSELSRPPAKDHEDLDTNNEKPESSGVGKRRMFNPADYSSMAEWNRIWEDEQSKFAKSGTKDLDRQDSQRPRSNHSMSTRSGRSGHQANSRESRDALMAQPGYQGE